MSSQGKQYVVVRESVLNANPKIFIHLKERFTQRNCSPNFDRTISAFLPLIPVPTAQSYEGK